MPVVLAVIVVALLGGLRLVRAESMHEIRMTGNRFAPEEITVRAGDTVRFVNGRGGLHNVAFREDILTPEQKKLLDAAMPGREDFRRLAEVPLAGPILVSEGEVYAVAVPALPPGRYEYFCAPHVAAGMKGTIIVVP